MCEKIFIKNMVCPRCISTVKQLLTDLSIAYLNVQLGEVELKAQLNHTQKTELQKALRDQGFELLADPSAASIEKIKNHLILEIQRGIPPHFSIQKFLSRLVFKDYSTLSKLFSEVEGITVEQYFILQRVERAKELLIYNEQTLQQVSIELGYSSSQHLSSQFKRVTGMTPTEFKKIGPSMRKPIDNISVATLEKK